MKPIVGKRHGFGKMPVAYMQGSQNLVVLLHISSHMCRLQMAYNREKEIFS